jgi:hypothetical protein
MKGQCETLPTCLNPIGKGLQEEVIGPVSIFMKDSVRSQTRVSFLYMTRVAGQMDQNIALL